MISPPTTTRSAYAPGLAARTDGAFLQQIIGLAGLALWEAWGDSMELIELELGTGAQSVFSLEPAQRQPGTLWIENVYPTDRDKLYSLLNASRSKRRSRSVDYRLIVGDGELLWVRHWQLARTSTRDGRCRLRGLLMAITERKHLEWECLRVSERECNRIGQELHDDLCQVLAGVTFMTRVIGQNAAKPGANLAAEIHELNQELLGATDRVRSMARGLFPVQLSYSTLRRALTEFVQQTKLRFPVKFTLHLPRRLAAHSPEQIIHIYRIAQESVSNSVRHGKATEIRLVVTSDRQMMRMAIEDNGTGFPLNGAQPEGIGMHVMQYRARVLGGELHCGNLSPAGAVVEVTYPSRNVNLRNTTKKTRIP